MDEQDLGKLIYDLIDWAEITQLGFEIDLPEGDYSNILLVGSDGSRFRVQVQKRPPEK